MTTLAEAFRRLSEGLRAAAVALNRDDEQGAAGILHETAVAIRKEVDDDA